MRRAPTFMRITKDGTYIPPFSEIHSIVEEERIIKEKGPGRRVYGFSELDKSLQERIKNGELPSCNTCAEAKTKSGFCGPMVDGLVFYDANGHVICDDYRKLKG